MDWKEVYIRRFQKKYFDTKLAETHIRNVVQEFDELFRQFGNENVIVQEGNEIVFPNCIVKYEITEEKFAMTKYSKENTSSILRRINVGLDNGGYVVREYAATGVRYDEINQNLIDFLFKDLLQNK